MMETRDGTTVAQEAAIRMLQQKIASQESEAPHIDKHALAGCIDEDGEVDGEELECLMHDVASDWEPHILAILEAYEEERRWL